MAKEANMKKIARTSPIRKDALSGNVWVGVDVHKNSYAVTILDEEGRDKHFTMASGWCHKILVAPLLNQVSCRFGVGF